MTRITHYFFKINDQPSILLTLIRKFGLQTSGFESLSPHSSVSSLSPQTHPHLLALYTYILLYPVALPLLLYTFCSPLLLSTLALVHVPHSCDMLLLYTLAVCSELYAQNSCSPVLNLCERHLSPSASSLYKQLKNKLWQTGKNGYSTPRTVNYYSK